MDEKWIEKELGKLANSLHFPPADLDQKTRMRIRKEMPLRKGRSVSRTKLKTMGILPASALVVVLVCLATMAFLQFSGPAGGGELALGRYVSEDGLAWVELKEDNRFEFCRYIATSYWPNGDYSIQEDELVLSVVENEQYRFSIVGDTIVFQSGEYAESLIEIGAVFTRAVELEHLPSPYPAELAKANGDVVQGHNLEKLDKFIDNFQADIPDRVRIVEYTMEGDAIISDLIYKAGKLKLFNDTTRDRFGSRAITEYELQDVYQEVRDEYIYYLAKLISGQDIPLTYMRNDPDNQSLNNIKIVDITGVEAEKGYEFTIQTSENVDDVLFIYTPSGSGEIKAAYVLPGNKTGPGIFTIGFDFPQVNGMAHVLAFQGDTGVDGGDYRLVGNLATQEYNIPQKQGGKIPQLYDMTMVADGKRNLIAEEQGYSLGNEMYFELTVSDNVTRVEYVFFSSADFPTSAIIYPGIEIAQGKHRIDFPSSEAGHGFFLIYNQAGDDNVVLRPGNIVVLH